jgi:hypothetical protein
MENEPFVPVEPLTPEGFPDRIPYLHETRERFLDGVAFLDIHSPGWEHSVYQEKLNITSCRSCVLGQLYGSFYDAKSNLNLSENDTVRFGFMLPYLTTVFTGEEMRAAWKYLEDLWAAEIARRTNTPHRQ